ncbi:hypothetical protein ETAA8_13320 [Anatilimnocola aggregata]|uniref:Uncharacterized protein n=1 Tax=Anatilimnocola aggregata TaxID=2528021 RepID=A0A517Y7P8_9BACT|nr:hypothetical protein [Anatilimnocola aggregata]QDU26256.1 hypothetical protein ETAA8_13320 [Anatilimnocola aggregata]
MQMNLQSDELVNRWKRQIGSRKPYRRQRLLAAIGFLYRAKDRTEPFIELHRLLTVVVFDDPIGRAFPALRVAGYGARQVPHGVQWGGPDNSKFYKDLRLEPEAGGWGLRIDTFNCDVLHIAMQLQATLHRVDRFTPRSATLQPQLPRLWAGFPAQEAESMRASGPEFAGLCDKFSILPDAMLEKFRREHQGLVCFPMDWVSSDLHRSLAVFADMSETPRTQVFRLTDYPEGLQGFQGAAAFDFYHSSQREQFTSKLERARRKQEQTHLPLPPNRNQPEEVIPQEADSDSSQQPCCQAIDALIHAT